jgi:chorismate mutase
MVKAIRGAVQVEADDTNLITDASQLLYKKMVLSNNVDPEMIISLVISVTDDISSKNPASSLRDRGIDSFPLFCVQEMKVANQLPRTIRFLMHVEFEKKPEHVIHIYEGGAKVLRPDL